MSTNHDMIGSRKNCKTCASRSGMLVMRCSSRFGKLHGTQFFYYTITCITYSMVYSESLDGSAPRGDASFIMENDDTDSSATGDA